MTTTTFGTGDYGGYDDWTFASGTFYTDWNTSQFNPGNIGRVTKLAARWDAYNGLSPFTCTGVNVMWRASTNNKEIETSGVSGTSRGAGTTETMHDIACSDFWVSSGPNHFLGAAFGPGSSFIFAWKDGSNGGYSGKTAGDANNTGGTVNWGGTTNGGFPVFATLTLSNLYVRRSSAWVRVFVGTRRTGAWNSPELVRVRRSGSWTVVNWLQQTERHIPPEGMPVEINLGEYWEPGWMIEEGEMGWFGSVDPTGRGIDWTKPGEWDWPHKKWSGRYNSSESDEVAEERLRAEYEYDRAMRWEDYESARLWYPRFQPPIPSLEQESEQELELILVR